MTLIILPSPSPNTFIVKLTYIHFKIPRFLTSVAISITNNNFIGHTQQLYNLFTAMQRTNLFTEVIIFHNSISISVLYGQNLEAAAGVFVSLFQQNVFINGVIPIPTKQLNVSQCEVQNYINEFIAPYINSHGGHIEVIDIIDRQCTIKLSGSCAGCPMKEVTLKEWIQVQISSNFPLNVVLI